jgi:proteasome accessory factor C
VPGRDEATEREVDPMRVVSLAGHWYLEGWCHRAEGVRLFRLGRVLAADVLDQDGTPPPQARSRDLDDRLFTPSPSDTLVTVDLWPRSQWVIDHYRPEHTEELDDGRVRAMLRIADTGWLRQLVLRSGGGVVVVGPPEVVTQVAQDAHLALARYS